MNFLQLCQAYRLEAGISGTGPSSVTGNSNNEYARIVGWVAQADLEIQMKYDDWKFMWDEFSFQTVASQASYTDAEVLGSASLNIERIDTESVRCYLTADTVSTEQWLTYDEWRNFHPYWRHGTMRTAEGKPQVWSRSPDDLLHLGYVPNDVYTVTGAYWKRPVTLAANSDTPLYPVEYHMLPVWWALVNYAGFEEGSFQYTHAQNMLNRLWSSIERRQRPAVSFGPPLA